MTGHNINSPAVLSLQKVWGPAVWACCLAPATLTCVLISQSQHNELLPIGECGIPQARLQMAVMNIASWPHPTTKAHSQSVCTEMPSDCATTQSPALIHSPTSCSSSPDTHPPQASALLTSSPLPTIPAPWSAWPSKLPLAMLSPSFPLL